MESTSPTPFDTLELGQKILKYLPTNNLLTLPLVSRQWHGRLLTLAFWKSFIPFDILTHKDAEQIIGDVKHFVVHKLCRTEEELSDRIIKHITSLNLLINTRFECYISNNLQTPCTVINNFLTRDNDQGTAVDKTEVFYLDSNIKLNLISAKQSLIDFDKFNLTFTISYLSINFLKSIPEFKKFYDFYNDGTGDDFSVPVLHDMLQNNLSLEEEFHYISELPNDEKNNAVIEFLSRNCDAFHNSCRRFKYSEEFIKLITLDIFRYDSESEYDCYVRWLPYYLKLNPKDSEVLSNFFSNGLSEVNLSSFLQTWENKVNSEMDSLMQMDLSIQNI
jgi:hypothetical protein